MMTSKLPPKSFWSRISSGVKVGAARERNLNGGTFNSHELILPLRRRARLERTRMGLLTYAERKEFSMQTHTEDGEYFLSANEINTDPEDKQINSSPGRTEDDKSSDSILSSENEECFVKDGGWRLPCGFAIGRLVEVPPCSGGSGRDGGPPEEGGMEIFEQRCRLKK
ncbi:hypothetical protein AXG93_3671s1250 [Marchantia polymorpha subsp. ruderalis]|uniref:Uncharacterized protein n=1 Tax=Marchantia polymorpha subsp. ruderalis TaxID=1480154 RepID=A0A176WJP0_MARPO|nr:hypothetical protein AXG93_3671s1250 [Marchantia polymorpha subsp. ruderalis]